jgi:hypothetical protein
VEQEKKKKGDGKGSNTVLVRPEDMKKLFQARMKGHIDIQQL